MTFTRKKFPCMMPLLCFAKNETIPPSKGVRHGDRKDIDRNSRRIKTSLF
jgi:hypothetical protein